MFLTFKILFQKDNTEGIDRCNTVIIFLSQLRTIFFGIHTHTSEFIDIDIKLMFLTFKILFQKDNTEGIDANQITAVKEKRE